MFSVAWLWVYFGLALILMELAAPGFILCFFGLSAMTVGVLRFIFGDAFTATWQLASFSALSILYIVLLRHYCKQVFVGNKKGTCAAIDNEYIGRVGKVVETIVPPNTGRIQLGDAEWSAIAETQIESGVNVKIVAQDNLTFKVEAL